MAESDNCCRVFVINPDSCLGCDCRIELNHSYRFGVKLDVAPEIRVFDSLKDSSNAT